MKTSGEKLVDIVIDYMGDVAGKTVQERKKEVSGIFNSIAADLRSHGALMAGEVLWLTASGAGTVPGENFDALASAVAKKGFQVSRREPKTLKPE